MVEYWECGFKQEPPELVASILRDDEQLLWAARLMSTATSRIAFRVGMTSLIIGAALSFIAPWGEGLYEFCGPDPSRRCPRLFYISWPLILFLGATGLFQLWSGWKAENRPWLISYALSTSRALMIDESRPKDFRYSYLRLHPPKLGPSGILGFEGESKGFVGLDLQATTRALYWATDGLGLVKEQIGATP